MKGGVILFRGSGSAARRYVEADRSRADEYYLGADDAVADYAVLDNTGEATDTRSLTADEYEGWVDWRDPVTGEQMGTPRAAARGYEGFAVVRGDDDQRPQESVRRGRPPPGSLRCPRRSAAGCPGRDTALARSALCDAGRPA